MITTGQLVLVLVAVTTWLRTTYGQDCILTVPAAATTAKGLASPYFMSGCKQETVPSFVEATILDTATGALFVYNPLVINLGDKPLVPPVVPTITKTSVVGIWFGTNGNTLTLQNAPGTKSLMQARCVNGLQNSIFGQFAQCNAFAFWAAAKAAKAKITLPPLGTGSNGKPCYTTRSYQVVDMDPSDNVIASYLVLPNNTIVQATTANKAKFPNAVEENNGSDNLLLDAALRPNLGCQAFTAQDLADSPGVTKGSLALNELQAAAMQASPIATVPPSDPMCLVNNKISGQKLNLYRMSVNQPPVVPAAAKLANIDKTFCTNYQQVGAPSIMTDMAFTKGKTSPAPGQAIDLFTFLCSRFAISFGADGLNCVGKLNVTNPVIPVMDNNGVTTDCQFNLAMPAAMVSNTPQAAKKGAAPTMKTGKNAAI